MSSIFHGLNDPQRMAVQTVNGPLLVLAGAGTGKTKLITCRIANLIRMGVHPERIVALTFTNKAAREMRERISHLIGNSQAKSLFVGTFHSYCLKLLKANPREFGLAERFSLVATGDQVDLVRRATEERGWQQLFNPKDALFRISKLKNSSVSSELQDELREIAGSGSSDEDVMLHELREIYDRQLRINNAIDFDDCILKVVMSLATDTALRNRISGEIDFMLVDEFQDTNFLQLDLVRLLGKRTSNVCVVGDDDQSIYSWRGAVSRNIEMFERLFPGTVLVKLEQNYRCTMPILNAANSVIINNQFRKPKQLWSTKDSNQQIAVSSHSDEMSEANDVAKKIMSLRGQGQKYSDVAVLYRMNAMARGLEVALRNLDIPYRVYGGQSFFERKEVRDFLAYLRIAVQPDDRMSILRIINTPNRGIGLKTLEKVCAAADLTRKSIYSVLLDPPPEIGSSALKSIRSFVEVCQELGGEQAESLDALEALGHRIIKLSGLDREIRAKNSDQNSQDRKLRLLRSLPGWIANSAKSAGFGNSDKTLLNILDDMLLDSAAEEEDAETRDEVSLMTIHSSKGLEFSSVFLVGAEDDILPHQNSVDEGKVDEERRLFYVAITRAKELLEISHCAERSGGHEIKIKKPSRFLSEIDASTIAAPLTAEKIAEQKESRKSQTIQRLSDLKRSLKNVQM
jgi:DNA helicase-2/ATP-dependent DNA helicase PcrA